MPQAGKLGAGRHEASTACAASGLLVGPCCAGRIWSFGGLFPVVCFLARTDMAEEVVP